MKKDKEKEKDKDKDKKKKRALKEVPPPRAAVPAEAPAPAPAPVPAKREAAENPDALLAKALSKVGGKWKLRVLLALDRSGKESLRYGEVKSMVDGITDMMLSQSLKELAEDGLVERRQYQEIPPKVEYRMTPAAKGAIPAAKSLCEWMGRMV